MHHRLMRRRPASRARAAQPVTLAARPRCPHRQQRARAGKCREEQPSLGRAQPLPQPRWLTRSPRTETRAGSPRKPSARPTPGPRTRPPGPAKRQRRERHGSKATESPWSYVGRVEETSAYARQYWPSARDGPTIGSFRMRGSQLKPPFAQADVDGLARTQEALMIQRRGGQKPLECGPVSSLYPEDATA